MWSLFPILTLRVVTGIVSILVEMGVGEMGASLSCSRKKEKKKKKNRI